MTTIIPIFRDNAFDPEEVDALTIAYKNACAALGGAQQSPELQERIAAKIISIATTGERDPIRLYMRCLQDGAAPPIILPWFRRIAHTLARGQT